MKWLTPLGFAAAIAAAFLPASAVRASPPTTPAGALAALRTTPIDVALLPAGLRVTKIAPQTLAARWKKYDPVGSVGLSFNDYNDFVQYTVFPTNRQAMLQYRYETQSANASAVSHHAATSSSHIEEDLADLLFGFGNQTNGATYLFFTYRNVVGKIFVASAATTSKASPFPALQPKATALAAFALAYLASALARG